MKILVTGGSGFVGARLCKSLLEASHEVTAFGTRNRHPLEGIQNFQYIKADTAQPGAWQKTVSRMDAAVNLAGRSIFHRWTNAYKKDIRNSRVFTTRNLVEGISGDRPFVLVSASAVGYYGDRGEMEITEETPGGTDFLAEVSKQWEKAAFSAKEKGVRVAVTRFGVVLGQGGGALEKMVPAFRMMAGGPIGDGRQWFPWIHMDDVISGIRFLVENTTADGPFNFVSPGIVRNKEFVKTLAAVLHRPAVVPAPVFMIRAALGEMAAVVLSSQRCRSDRLSSLGYEFRHPDLAAALRMLVEN